MPVDGRTQKREISSMTVYACDGWNLRKLFTVKDTVSGLERKV